MKRIVTADIHISKSLIDAYRTVFLKETLPALVDKYKPDQLLVLGDITQDKDMHPASLVNEVVEGFHKLASLCHVIILQGNHDYSSIDYPFFKFLDCIDNIRWISSPTELDGCLYLPHTRDHKKDWQGLQFEDRDYIFAHNTFTGARANGQTLAGITTTIFPDDAFVLSGDIHEPQTLGPVTYIGSPYAVNFGDDFQPRMLLLDDLEVKSIKLYGRSKKLISWDWSKDSDKLCDGWEAYNPGIEGDIVKIQVYIGMEHVAKWPEIRQQVEAWAVSNKFVIHTITPVVTYEAGERQKHIKSVRRSDSQYVEAFVKRSGVDADTAKVGKSIADMI